ncbi:hypothetical protein [Sphingobacterium sp.]|uniref:hypothetical protein n=1 Tax=Sphingobacterium sp. TaxID=341027 RepID=UPI0028A6D54C|nr:hypothetical protein [Sphingobacterium sp.]
MKKDKPIKQLRPEEAQKQFASYFEKIAYRRTVSEVFTDFIDYTVLMLNINKKAADFK